MAVYNWSQIAASNSNSDPSINWAEGQAPSSVNDSARAMMARLAEYFADQSGSLETTGVGTAYSLLTNQGFDSLVHMHKKKFKTVFHTTCGATPTLNVDGLGAQQIAFVDGVLAWAGSIQQGSIWDITFFNTTPGFFYLSGGSAHVPVGTVHDFAGFTAPPGYLLCAGQSVSRATYASLFSVISTNYGAGDGVSTFGIPDYRGRVLAGKDDMGGAGAGRINTINTDGGTIIGTVLGSSGGSSTHVQTNAEMAKHNHPAVDTGHGHGISTSSGNSGVATAGSGPQTAPGPGANFTNNDGLTILPGSANLVIADSGASNAMAWLQPTMIVNKIIYAGA